MDGSKRVPPADAGDEQAVDVVKPEPASKPARGTKPGASTKTRPAPKGNRSAPKGSRSTPKTKMPPTLVEQNRVVVTDHALASLVGLAAHEVPGLVGMAPVSLGEGLRRVLGLTQVDEGVVVDHPHGAGRADVDVHVVVAYGVNIPVVAESVRERVRYAAKHLAGIELDEVRVYVQGVSRG